MAWKGDHNVLKDQIDLSDEEPTPGANIHGPSRSQSAAAQYEDPAGSVDLSRENPSSRADIEVHRQRCDQDVPDSSGR